MSVLFVLISISILVASAFLFLFIWAVKSGQFDDTQTPSFRILFEGKDKAGENDKEAKPSKQD